MFELVLQGTTAGGNGLLFCEAHVPGKNCGGEFARAGEGWITVQVYSCLGWVMGWLPPLPMLLCKAADTPLQGMVFVMSCQILVVLTLCKY